MSLTKTTYAEIPKGDEEQHRRDELQHGPKRDCENQPSSTSSSKSICLKVLNKISFLANFTIKWKGNNRKICTILFIILQLLLTAVLFGKIGIEKKNRAKAHPNNFTVILLESKSMPLVSTDDYSSTSVTKSNQQRTILNNKPSTQYPARSSVTRHECIQFEVSSEEEYQLKHKDISEQSTICLMINFNDHKKWNLTNSSLKIDMVKEITLVGCVDMLHLATVIETFKHAYKITLGQTSNKLCDSNNNQCMHTQSHESYTNEKYLFNLNEIVFENIDCKYIFEFLSKTFYMNAVRSLKIRNTVVDQSNIMGIRQLLKQYKYSLEILHFTDVTWKVSLFDRISNQLPNLIELHMDFISEAHVNIEFLKGINGANHLLKIVSMRGNLTYSQFGSILKFKIISNVTLGVDIPSGVTSLDLFPVNALSNLGYMELFLNFRDISKCYLLSDYDIERPYVTKLNSNCDEEF